MNYIDKIITYCRSLGISQSSFEKAAGLSKGQISKWKRGVRPGIGSQIKAARFMHLSLDELICEEEDPPYTRIPLIDPCSQDDQTGHLHILPESITDPSECYALVIPDESMEPGICKGDVVIVDTSAEPDSGDIVAVETPYDTLTCRKILRNDSGIIFQPFNADYDAAYFRNSELESLNITVSGRIVSRIHQY